MNYEPHSRVQKTVFAGIAVMVTVAGLTPDRHRLPAGRRPRADGAPANFSTRASRPCASRATSGPAKSARPSADGADADALTICRTAALRGGRRTRRREVVGCSTGDATRTAVGRRYDFAPAADDGRNRCSRPLRVAPAGTRPIPARDDRLPQLRAADARPRVSRAGLPPCRSRSTPARHASSSGSTSAESLLLDRSGRAGAVRRRRRRAAREQRASAALGARLPALPQVAAVHARRASATRASPTGAARPGTAG